MLNLIGEYECKLDGKSRLLFPAALKRQIPAVEGEHKFVLNRGFEQCLVLHTWDEWTVKIQEIDHLSDYVRQNRDFKRYYFRGATELLLDSANRLLLPKTLLEYAGIEKDMVLFAYSSKIEIWDAVKYKTLLNDEPEDFARLAEIVMNKKEINLNSDVS
jgi:MraZ protein